jgi:transcription-repair coupling factor (superfamily II helicase)
VRIRAQALAVSEVSAEKGRLKLRVSPQTPLDPMQLMAWVGAQKGAQFSPDGTVLVPAAPVGPVRQAQELLLAWAAL